MLLKSGPLLQWGAVLLICVTIWEENGSTWPSVHMSWLRQSQQAAFQQRNRMHLIYTICENHSGQKWILVASSSKWEKSKTACAPCEAHSRQSESSIKRISCSDSAVGQCVMWGWFPHFWNYSISHLCSSIHPSILYTHVSYSGSQGFMRVWSGIPQNNNKGGKSRRKQILSWNLNQTFFIKPIKSLWNHENQM